VEVEAAIVAVAAAVEGPDEGKWGLEPVQVQVEE
jgi:hypothetical protein